MTERPALQRATDDRVIAGVCAGIADYFGWSRQHTRIGYVVLAALSAAFPGIGVYLVLWFLMPGAPRTGRSFDVRHPDEPL